MPFQSALPSAGPQVFFAVPFWHVAQPKLSLFVSVPVLIFDPHHLLFAKCAEREEKRKGLFWDSPDEICCSC